MCFLDDKNSNCIYFTNTWSELQKISKTNQSIFATTFSELDVQQSYFFQIISNDGPLSKNEFQSILRIILFPSRRLIRFIDENYSIISLKRKIDGHDICDKLGSDLKTALKQFSKTFSKINNLNDLCSDSESSKSSTDHTLISDLDQLYINSNENNNKKNTNTLKTNNINKITTNNNGNEDEEENQDQDEIVVNENNYDFSLLTFEDKLLINGIHIMLQHFYQIFKIYFPKFDFDYNYTKFTKQREKQYKKMKNIKNNDIGNIKFNINNHKKNSATIDNSNFNNNFNNNNFNENKINNFNINYNNNNNININIHNNNDYINNNINNYNDYNNNYIINNYSPYYYNNSYNDFDYNPNFYNDNNNNNDYSIHSNYQNPFLSSTNCSLNNNYLNNYSSDMNIIKRPIPFVVPSNDNSLIKKEIENLNTSPLYNSNEIKFEYNLNCNPFPLYSKENNFKYEYPLINNKMEYPSNPVERNAYSYDDNLYPNQIYCVNSNDEPVPFNIRNDMFTYVNSDIYDIMDKRRLSLGYTPGYDTDKVYNLKKSSLLVTHDIESKSIFNSVNEIYIYIDYLEKLASTLNCFRVRHILSKEASKYLKKWIKNHKKNPYPTKKEKRNLCKETGLTEKQLNCWFINARRRYIHDKL